MGQVYAFRPTAADADGDTLSFRVGSLPGWASYDRATGTITGTPTTVGKYLNVEVRVTDGRYWTRLPAFSITVTQPAATTAPENRAPTISGTPVTTARVSQPYAFRPTAVDADGDTLTFSILGKPAWATFDSTDGTLYGTPSATDAKVFAGIVVNASDGKATVSLPAFDIAVAAAENRAPTISGTPVTTARVSQPYAFRPTAADADGDPLTFSILGKPAWATFDSTDGTLYGTPSATDARMFSGIVVNASDGKATVSLPAFDIAVAAAPTSSVKVSWHPPSTNVDGTPVTDLAGYRVSYGNVAGQYNYSLPVSSPDITSVVIEGLATATTWYFVAKSVSASGVESAYSTPVSKTL